MKKLFAMLLIAALMLTAPAALAEKTRIVLWHSMSDEAGVLMDKYVSEFNATIGAEQGIEVEAVFQGTYADATTKMNGILSAGNLEALPHVMQMDATGKIAYLNSGVAYTVDAMLADAPEAKANDLLDAALANWSYAGVQLGLPFATSTTVMYYNKTLLDAAGLDAPETFADIARLSAVTDADGNALTVYACVPNTPTLANWLGQLGSYVVNKKNGSEGSADKLDCLENGALAEFLSEWKALYASGALTCSAGSTDAFVAGKQVLLTGSSSNITSMMEKIDGRFEMGVTVYPKVNEGASFGATVNGSCLVMFDKGADNAASRALVEYLTGAEVQADFAIHTGYIPSNRAALETEAYQALIAANPAYGVGIRQLADTPASMRSVTVGPAADFYYAIQDCITEMLAADLSVEETVELMEDELGGLLTQYARANG